MDEEITRRDQAVKLAQRAGDGVREIRLHHDNEAGAGQDIAKRGPQGLVFAVGDGQKDAFAHSGVHSGHASPRAASASASSS